MKYYFTLQFTRLKRWFNTIGINPILGIALTASIFIFSSKFLFLKTELAHWLYLILAFSFIIKLGERNRNIQLKIIFNRISYLKIRSIENGILILPFTVYLIYEIQFIAALFIFSSSILFVFFNLDRTFSNVIPTPFKKIPFENIVGFRKTVLLIGIVYFVLFKAIQVDNYNLGVVSLGSLFLICMSYYIKPEQPYFVWIFTDNAIQFMKRKVLNAIICASIISIPGLLLICAFFTSYIVITLAVCIVGLVYLMSIIFAKYSAYPKEMSIPQGFLYALSLWFPPLLLLVIPIFYKKSKQKLEPILEW